MYKKLDFIPEVNDEVIKIDSNEVIYFSKANKSEISFKLNDNIGSYEKINLEVGDIVHDIVTSKKNDGKIEEISINHKSSNSINYENEVSKILLVELYN